MPQASVSSLILSNPIPRSEIELGRLILNPMYPDDECHQPAASKPSSQASGTAAAIMKSSIQRLPDFRETLDHAQGTKLELALLKLLSVSSNVSKGNSAAFESAVCFRHRVSNPETYFKAVCKEITARKWIEDFAQRPKTNVFLVCGFKTLTDAKVIQKNKRSGDIGTSATVPLATIAGAAAGVPISLPDGLGDVKASLDRTYGLSEEVEYTAPGELVYAVQCRKLRFKWFSTKAETASLEKEDLNCWKSFVGDRSGVGDANDGIEVELADSVELEDVEGEFDTFDSVELDGEQIMFKPFETDEEDTEDV